MGNPIPTLEIIENIIKEKCIDLKTIGKNSLMGKYLVVQKTNAIGVSIKIKNDKIIIRDIIPSVMLTAIVLNPFIGRLVVRLSKQLKQEIYFHKNPLRDRFYEVISSILKNELDNQKLEIDIVRKIY